MNLSHVSLFSGIGGMDLAAEAAGFETKLQVESAPFPLSIIERHWPDVPRITDVREVGYDERWAKPTVVSGGFPCQPFSVAGKRAGTEDDRYLWPEMLRIIRELQPTWIVGENVHGLLSIDDGLEIDRIMASLEAEAYSPWILNYPAAGVGANHRRYRVFIMAHRVSERLEGHPGNEAGSIRQKRKFSQQDRSAPSNGVRRSERRLSRTSRSKIGGGKNRANTSGDTRGKQHRDCCDARRRRSFESFLGRVADGFSYWLDEPEGIARVTEQTELRSKQLTALGNSVVPAQAYPVFASIAHAEGVINAH